jgi:hypothetical protein
MPPLPALRSRPVTVKAETRTIRTVSSSADIKTVALVALLTAALEAEAQGPED